MSAYIAAPSIRQLRRAGWGRNRTYRHVPLVGVGVQLLDQHACESLEHHIANELQVFVIVAPAGGAAAGVVGSVREALVGRRRRRGGAVREHALLEPARREVVQLPRRELERRECYCEADAAGRVERDAGHGGGGDADCGVWYRYRCRWCADVGGNRDEGRAQLR